MSCLMSRSLRLIATSFLRLTTTCLVVMTSAQVLLIVVGNPAILSLDPLWRSDLNYLRERADEACLTVNNRSLLTC
ncbi:hypothetical protein M378DRAFT_169528 [Amanita muscaria Koide BX008]|uniref:Uncharacterized protein n=1 Tax=Amanita muscaria (strain Koide BX008) TaxID=946122 RepID=A0A0C2SYN1_AMAMK|nr:hypothetical protein M378DRAFT_169528 [Amanita muscaria Koide BX008]